MSELAIIIQALLFSAAEPVKLAALVDAVGAPEEDVASALTELSVALESTGLRLQDHASTWQLVTAPVASSAVKRYLQLESHTDLSRAALETLAMIAYRGPISRSSLDELRGVNSDAMVRGLLQRGLITEHSKAKAATGTLYTVSHLFLQHVGLTSLDQLPQLTEGQPHEA